MSHLPVNLSVFNRSTYTLGYFCTRMQLARQSPTTFTTANFTVPAVESDVTISVSSSTGFQNGDYVVIGTRVCMLKAPVHSSTGAGALIFSGYYPGSLTSGNVIGPTGHAFISVASGNRTLDTTLAGWVVPNSQQASNTVSITLADRSKIDSGGIVIVSNYAGLFQVQGSPPSGTTLTLKLIKAGDLLAGATCIREDSYTYTGAPVSQGYPLFHVDNKPYEHFFPADAFAVAVSYTGADATTAAISIGYSAGSDTARARMGNFMQAKSVQSGSVLTTGTIVPLATNLSETNYKRVAVPFGMPLMACVTTASGTFPTSDHTIDLLVRGHFSQG